MCARKSDTFPKLRLHGTNSVGNWRAGFILLLRAYCLFEEKYDVRTPEQDFEVLFFLGLRQYTDTFSLKSFSRCHQSFSL